MKRRVGLVLLGLLAGASPTAPAGADPNLDPDAMVRIVNVAPQEGPATVTVAVDDSVAQDLAFGSATSFMRVQPGAHRLQVGAGDSQGFVAAAGCLHTVLILSARPTRPQHIDIAECAPGRISDGRSSIRFVHATGDSGAAMLHAGMATTARVDPFAASPRVEVDPGSVVLEVRGVDSEVFGQRRVEAEHDVAYTAVWAGGGETPLRLLWFEDGRQPPTPPPVRIPIDTDIGDSSGTTVAGATVAFALVLALRQRFRRPVVCVAVLTAIASGCSLDGGYQSAVPITTATTLQPETGPSPGMPPRPANPTRIESSTIGVAAPVIPLDRLAGSLLPEILAPHEVGWFHGSSVPGEVGVSALAGHVGSRRGSAVFERLHELSVGDVVDVVDADDTTRSFVVRGMTLAAKADLDVTLFAFSPEPRILLFTCAGPVDLERGLRTQNLIVLASNEQRPTIEVGV